MQSTIVWWGVIVAAVASYAFGAVYYMTLGNPWLAALGKTREEVSAAGPYGPPWMPFVLSFIGQLVMAFLFASLLAHFDPAARTIGASIAAAFFIWLAFILVPLITNHAYGGSKPALTAIDGLHWLGVVIIQALIIGRFGLA